jgi:ribosomal protein L28
MSKECRICGKKGMIARRLNKLRGKYNPSPKYKQQPNIQWVKVPLDIKQAAFKVFAGKRVLACTKCRKTTLKK